MTLHKRLNDNRPDQHVASDQNGAAPRPASQLTPIQELLSFDVEEPSESAKPPVSPYVRSEVNFLRYPFFVLTKRDIHKIDRIEYQEAYVLAMLDRQMEQLQQREAEQGQHRGHAQGMGY